MLLSPVSFRIRVSHQTQEYPSEFLPAELGIWQGASWRSLLLLGVHADHRIADGKKRRRGVVDVPELGVTVGMLAALQRLGVRLQAVAGLMQQPLHQRRRCRVALGTQLPGQRVQRLSKREVID